MYGMFCSGTSAVQSALDRVQRPNHSLPARLADTGRVAGLLTGQEICRIGDLCPPILLNLSLGPYNPHASRPPIRSPSPPIRSPLPPNSSPPTLFRPLVIHIPTFLSMQARDFRIRVSYDISKMKDGLLNLKRKLQGHGTRVIKITIPPTGVIAVTRSTGSVTPFGPLLALMILYRQTIYLTEGPLPPVIPPLARSQDDPQPQDVPQPQDAPQPQSPRQQDSQRYASGSARNHDDFGFSDTWGTSMTYIHNVLLRLSN